MQSWITLLLLFPLIPLASCGGSGGTRAPSRMPGPGGRPSETSGATALLGTFELSFAADPNCTALPTASLARTYTTTLTRGQSVATLRGGRFPSTTMAYSYWNVLYTRVEGDSADIWFQDPPVWESLSDDSYVVIYGDAHGRMAGDASTLQFWGRFEYCPDREPDGYPECEVPETACESANHQLTLRRSTSQ
jgi:hypothetical protein